MMMVLLPLAFVSIAGINGYSIYRNLRDANRCERIQENIKANAKEFSAIADKRKRAGGQAVMLWHFSANADALLIELDQLWHHWNNAGEKLVHPIAENEELKQWPATSHLAIERRDYTVRYSDHIQYLKEKFPTFDSPVTELGYPSEAEYSVLVAVLRKHVKELEDVAQHIWDKGQPMDFGK